MAKATGTITVTCSVPFEDDSNFSLQDQAYEALFEHVVGHLGPNMVGDVEISDITVEEQA